MAGDFDCELWLIEVDFGLLELPVLGREDLEGLVLLGRELGEVRGVLLRERDGVSKLGLLY
jgi:hypothetical protein